MYYIYILYSPTSDLYYVGYTNDYVRRLNEHNHQDYFDTFTSKHRPWSLSAVFECGDSEKEAIKIERFIKKQKSRRFIEKMLKTEKFEGMLAQLVRVPHVRD
jgi:putative endonuclease